MCMHEIIGTIACSYTLELRRNQLGWSCSTFESSGIRYASRHIHTNTCIHIHLCICLFIYLYVCMYLCMYVRICKCKCKCICICTCICICILMQPTGNGRRSSIAQRLIWIKASVDTRVFPPGHVMCRSSIDSNSHKSILVPGARYMHRCMRPCIRVSICLCIHVWVCVRVYVCLCTRTPVHAV